MEEIAVEEIAVAATTKAVSGVNLRQNLNHTDAEAINNDKS